MAKRAILALLIICLLAIPKAAWADGFLYCNAPGSNSPVGTVASVDQWYAQGFRPSSGVIIEFTFTLLANTGSPTGTMTWNIRADSSGKPGSSLATGTLTPTASAVNTVTVSGGPDLAGGTTYWLELHSTSRQSNVNNYWTWEGINTNPCPFGYRSGSTDSGSTWTNNTTVDQTFSITTLESTPTPPNTPVPTATILPSSTPVPTVPTATILPSSTPVPTVPTATEKPNPTLQPTFDDVDVATATEKPNPTNQPTFDDVDVPTATEKPDPTGIPTSTPNDTPVDTPTQINTPIDTPTQFVDDDSGFGGPTLTPSDTPTPSLTFTPSITPTSTPDVCWRLTLPPTGQAGCIEYTVSAGEAVIFALLGFISLIVMIIIFFLMRKMR